MELPYSDSEDLHNSRKEMIQNVTSFPFDQNKAKMPTTTISSHYCIGGTSQCNTRRIPNKRYTELDLAHVAQ